jgi:hypothetical protein
MFTKSIKKKGILNICFSVLFSLITISFLLQSIAYIIWGKLPANLDPYFNLNNVFQRIAQLNLILFIPEGLLIFFLSFFWFRYYPYKEFAKSERLYRNRVKLGENQIRIEYLKKLGLHLLYKLQYVVLFSNVLISLVLLVWVLSVELFKVLDIYDWLQFDLISELNFHKGFYFSLLASILFSLPFFIAFWSAKRILQDSKIRLTVFTIVLGCGFFLSIYSIVNLIYNSISFTSYGDWYATENLIGLLPIRVTSLVIFIGLMKYTYMHVLNRTILIERGFKIFFKKNEVTYTPYGTISYATYSSIYFSQIAFYIITLLILFYTYRIQYQNQISSILSWVLFFIIDDWFIVYNYSYKINKIRDFDKYRLRLSNTVLFVFSVVLLIKISSWYFIIPYMLFVIFLMYISMNNYQKIGRL